MHTLQRFFNSINTTLAAGFCERWPATHEREGFCGWPPCQRVAVQRKKLAANVSQIGLVFRRLDNENKLDKDELHIK